MAAINVCVKIPFVWESIPNCEIEDLAHSFFEATEQDFFCFDMFV